MKKYMKYIALAVSLLIVGLDQWFKVLAIEHLSTRPDLTLPVIQDVFHLTYVENRGAAFGMMDGMGIFLIVATGIILLGIILLILLNKIRGGFLLWSLSLVIGGGIGNLIDRIFRHYVVDYLDVRIIQFAVFNFADCCVVIGTILVVIDILFLDHTLFHSDRKKLPEPKAEADASHTGDA